MIGTGWVPREAVRLLVVDPRAGRCEVRPFAALADLLRPGDLLVVNDAATLPGLLRGRTATGAFVEARLVDTRPLRAVLFGPGDHRTRTEDRAPPPPVRAGDELVFGALRVRVVEVSPLSPRLVELEATDGTEAAIAAAYAGGRAVQYAHRPDELPLWAVQTAYATRPWAAEMPSAGRPLTWDLLLALRRRGVAVAALTHAAGLSATGDPALDAALPLPERYEIPATTAAAITTARTRGGRIIAVGTTVVRALEAAADPAGGVRPGPGVAELVLTPATRRQIVDGLLSGIHGPEESHYRLLGAFADAATLRAATATADAANLQGHELGDSCLILRDALAPSLRAA